jgi:transposase-like protein
MRSMRKSRLSQHKQGRLIEHFVARTTARTAARLCGVHRNTAAYYFLRLHEIIAYELEAEIEVDESYFGGKRKGKRGWGAAGKIPVFDLSRTFLIGRFMYHAICPLLFSTCEGLGSRRRVRPSQVVRLVGAVHAACFLSFSIPFPLAS